MKIWILTISLVAIMQIMLSQDFNYKRTKVFIGPSKNIKDFTFGYKDAMSSAFWVRTVQDFHICDQNKERSVYPAPKGDVDPLDDILNRELPKSTCEKGWVYQMLDVISDLDPTFRAVYVDGGTMLSVLVDDRNGANEIFRKGYEAFPDDWEILYRSAYHELFEMQNPEKAEELMWRAAKSGAPEWTYSLAAKLSSRGGRAAMALSVLEKVLDRDLGGGRIIKIQAQIERLKRVLEEEPPK